MSARDWFITHFPREFIKASLHVIDSAYPAEKPARRSSHAKDQSHFSIVWWCHFYAFMRKFQHKMETCLTTRNSPTRDIILGTWGAGTETVALAVMTEYKHLVCISYLNFIYYSRPTWLCKLRIIIPKALKDQPAALLVSCVRV